MIEQSIENKDIDLGLFNAIISLETDLFNMEEKNDNLDGEVVEIITRAAISSRVDDLKKIVMKDDRYRCIDDGKQCILVCKQKSTSMEQKQRLKAFVNNLGKV